MNMSKETACQSVPNSLRQNRRLVTSLWIVLLIGLGVLTGCDTSSRVKGVPEQKYKTLEQLAERARSSREQAPVIELWEQDYGDWRLDCTIPIKNSSINMKQDDLGCANDHAQIFLLINAKLGNYGFYDGFCDDDGRFDDDYYKYRVTQAGISLEAAMDVGNVNGINQEVVPGMVYFEGNYKNGIKGKLSCINMWDIR